MSKDKNTGMDPNVRQVAQALEAMNCAHGIEYTLSFLISALIGLHESVNPQDVGKLVEYRGEDYVVTLAPIEKPKVRPIFTLVSAPPTMQ